jgi:hypothetical protein
MDSPADPIIALYRLSNGILTTSLGDLSNDDARVRSRGGTGPSIAWTIGHLCHFKIQTLELLGQHRDNPFASTFEGGATDGRVYPPLADLAAAFSTLTDDVCASLASAASRLGAPMPGAGLHGEKRIRDTVLFFAWHEAYHIGGLGAIRREQGRVEIAELARGVKATPSPSARPMQ